MTLLVAWCGIDSRGVSSIYVASDSRLTVSSSSFCDNGLKTFFSKSSPDILGYCGDVVVASQILSQIESLLSIGALYLPTHSLQNRFEIISDIFQNSYSGFSKIYKAHISVVYCTRKDSEFKCFLLEAREGHFSSQELTLPEKSGKIVVCGSGKAVFNKNYADIQKGIYQDNSAGVFISFCKAIQENSEKTIGGPPQLVGLFRNDSGRGIGVIWEEKKFFAGLSANTILWQKIAWRNESFEICDGETGNRAPGAQIQPFPK